MRVSLALWVALCLPDDFTDARNRLMKSIPELDVLTVEQAARQVARTGKSRAIKVLVEALEECDRVGQENLEQSRKFKQELDQLQPDPSKKIGGKNRQQYDHAHQKFCWFSVRLKQLGSIRDAVGLAFGEIKSSQATRRMTTLLNGKEDAQLRAYVAEGLGRIKERDSVRALLRCLSREKEPIVRLAAVEGLKATGANSEDVIKALAKNLTADHWQIAVAAARAIEKIKSFECIDPLIESLKSVDGRVREEVNGALVTITGINRHGNHGAWKDWFERNKDAVRSKTFKPPAGEIGQDPNKAGATTFYGIPVTSKRVIFVLDASNSMASEANWKPDETTAIADPKIKLNGNTKIDVAKFELKKVIAGLPDDAKFNIVFFHNIVWSFSNRMETAERVNKEKAYEFIDHVGLNLATDIYEALKEAFRQSGVGEGLTLSMGDADTVYFLTDGSPWLRPAVRDTGVTDRDEIVKAVREWNRLPKVIIHAIGINAGGKSEKFLQQLSEESGGKYVKR